MSYYLPVLIVSVATGIPDDASFQPLPSGQVDYLSHNWREEDVWRSWRNMTKQKNEIANGVRLENASWRTWWKQRNKLKTVSPETLNWLKDSDVTWLYGPLHTANEWMPAPKPGPALSSPASSVALDLSGRAAQLTNGNVGENANLDYPHATKPILKHRTIGEMLTSALTPGALYGGMDLPDEEDDKGEEDDQVGDYLFSNPVRGAQGARPSLQHTKSDTNILRRFGTGSHTLRKKNTAPRIIAQQPDTHSYLNAEFSDNKRMSSSDHLMDIPAHAARLIPGGRHGEYTSRLPARSGSSDTSASSRSDSGDTQSRSPMPMPQKKHISFNPFVEQCIAIEKPKPKTRSVHGGASYNAMGGHLDNAYDYDADDGYDEDEEDGLYEDLQSQSDSGADEDDEDDVLQMRPSASRRPSMSSQLSQTPTELHRPQIRRSSTSRSYSSQTSDKEHVTIAPIAPTILKMGGSSGNGGGENVGRDIIGPGGSLFEDISSNPDAYSNGYAASYTHGYDYNRGTAGRDPQGSGGGQVYQSQQGNVYTVHGMGMHRGFGSGAGESWAHFGLDPSDGAGSDPAKILSGPFEASPSLADGAEEDGFDYFGGPDLEEDFTLRLHSERRQRRSGSTEGIDVVEGVRENGIGAIPYANGGADSVDRWNTRESKGVWTVGGPENGPNPSPDYLPAAILPAVSLKSRSFNQLLTSSPDYLPLPNRRIASLKSESLSRSLQPSSPETTPTPSNLTTPIVAIPAPGISSAHQIPPSSPPESTDSSLLSAPDMSPNRGRGRSLCTSPVSGYITSGSATSSAISSPGSRSVSESRSESRGRSHTRGSSCSDPERGRSRSRSSGGTNSPLGSVSPNSSRPGSVVAYGGGYRHSGREIQDGRGVRLYRKTSEDYIATGGRGRERDKRASESLSPPVANTRVRQRHGALSPPARRQMSSSMYQAYTVTNFGQRMSDPPAATIAVNGKLLTSPVNVKAGGMDGMDAKTSSSVSTSGVSTLYGAMAQGIPHSIPEEDDTRLRNTTPANSPVNSLLHMLPDRKAKIPPHVPSSSAGIPPGQFHSTLVASSSPSNPANSVGHSRTSSASSAGITNRLSPTSTQEDSGASSIVGRAADIVSSARGLLGAIWNSA